MIEDPELRKLFKAESEEHLAHLDDALLRLEKTPAEAALLEEAFRESHSLKGAARMLGLERIESAAHGLESILNAARKGEAPLTPEHIERMNQVLVDLRRHVLGALAEPVRAAATDAASRAGPEPECVGAATSRRGEGGIPVRPIAADIASPLSSASAENRPPAEARPREAALPFTTSAAVGAPFRVETVRVETRKLDELLTQVGELSVIQGRTQHRRSLLDGLLEQWAALERGRRNRLPGKSPRPVQTGEAEAFARFGGLLKQARDALVDDGSRLEATVGLLEDQVRGMRLLPLSTVFALFPRMVRDLAREQDKEVELVVDGGDITVDKRIIEEMKDPLMHLIRNAIDHGIESPVERARLGKPRVATVRLRALREDANVVLVVSDDGRGLDQEAIRHEAKKRGLVDEAALAAMTPAQLHRLIFTSGFSTSGYVTELSGRGVGLDVVRVTVERMKGGIRLDTQPGQGLAVQLRLPVSLATTRLLLARVGDRLYGLPVEFVHTARRVRPEALFTLEGRLAVLVDDRPVMVGHLAELLELPAPPKRDGRVDMESGVLACVVIQVGDERFGLLADDLPDEEEVVPKPLGAPLKRVRNVSALAMLGSGEICPVLNPADLLRSAHRIGAVRRGDADHGREIHPGGARKAVLLAEDSALIRAMEKRILEDAHYEVVTAVDGIDALNQLGGRAFAAVVSDIVMPNMDGLTLTARIRAEPRYRTLPVILVTSLASDEDKRRGLDAGANAYIAKPTFDQHVLLETLNRLIAP